MDGIQVGELQHTITVLDPLEKNKTKRDRQMLGMHVRRLAASRLACIPSYRAQSTARQSTVLCSFVLYCRCTLMALGISLARVPSGVAGAYVEGHWAESADAD